MERLKKYAAKVAETLDEMMDKCLIYCGHRGDDKCWKTIQLEPGILERLLIKNKVTPGTKKLAGLFDAYFHMEKILCYTCFQNYSQYRKIFSLLFLRIITILPQSELSLDW